MTDDERFWQALDALLAEGRIVIDRPRGSVHPRYPAAVYPLDYGYVDVTRSPDGEGIDVWLGSAGGRRPDAVICTVDRVKRDSEIKLLVGCTTDEKRAIMRFYNEHPDSAAVMINR